MTPQITSLDGREVIWSPLPKQAVAMTCPARELCYGGSKGSAKTDYLVGAALPILRLAHEKFVTTGRKQHRCRIIVFRKNLEDLKDFLAKSFDIYPYFDPQMGTDGYNKNEKTWTFTSGATITLRHLDGPTDHLGYNGHEFVAIFFDEVQQIPFEAYAFLSWQLRSKDPDYHRMRMIRCTANPGGEGWVSSHFFINEYPEGGKIVPIRVAVDGVEHESTRAFVRARTKDNPYLPPDYIAQMKSSMNEDEIAMYIDGDFNRVAGSFFSNLLRPSIHFTKSFSVPDSWDFRYSIDWGSTNPASWHLGAQDNDGVLYVIDELHTPGITGRTFGENLDKKFKSQAWCQGRKFANDEIYGVIDKQAMDRYGSEQTAAAGIMEWGFRIFAAQKDRVAGCNQMKERLLLDKSQRPRVVVFEDRCPNLVRALSAIPSNAPSNPEEYADNSQYSHACDSFRFLCMELPVRDSLAPRDRAMDEWERYLTAVKARRAPNPNYAGAGYE